MEPIHIYALLHTQVDSAIRWKEIEQHFAVRARRRRERRDHTRRVRQLLVGRPAPVPAPQPAVSPSM